MHVCFEKSRLHSKHEFGVKIYEYFHNAKIVDTAVTKTKPPVSKIQACLPRN